ncbi:MAG: element excision factor XisH family protein [Thiolinea sp.]
MPKKDDSHQIVKEALIKEGWDITDDPYVISYGERFLFVDLAASALSKGQFIGAQRKDKLIAVEIKEFRGKSAVNDLEQAIGQYVLYQLLLKQVDPKRRVYLAISHIAYDEIFSEPIGELVINELPMDLIVIDVQAKEVQKWIKKTTSKR